MLSAQVFEDLFTEHLTSMLQMDKVALGDWCTAILGSYASPRNLEDAAHIFKRLSQGFDFLCPSFEGNALAPLLLALRNQGGAKIRLLLIAHSPGMYAWEWALLRPLLAGGDVIIAPTDNARQVIEFMCPALAPFVRVIPHPMAPLPLAGGDNGRSLDQNTIVSLGRITAEKLLHRQVEAMALLRERGYQNLRLKMAGQLHDAATGEDSQYVRALAAKIKRLQLEEQVELVGAIYDDAIKARFISQARLLLNLSLTVEESFGKSVVEALGLGVPVLATRWNGLPETVGLGGLCLPLSEAGAGTGVDLPAERLAAAIEEILAAPIAADVCRAQAARFSPQMVLASYRQVLEEAVSITPAGPAVSTLGNEAAAPPDGLLGVTAPLCAFTWRELFDLHHDESTHLVRGLSGTEPPQPLPGIQLRSLLQVGTKRSLQQFMSGSAPDMPRTETHAIEAPPIDASASFTERVVYSVGAQSTEASRMACLSLARQAGRADLLNEGLARIGRDRRNAIGYDYLRVEMLRMAGSYAEAYALATTPPADLLVADYGAGWLRQIARICRQWDRPQLALPWLQRWLAMFPDAPESGPVWLDRAVNAANAGPDYLDEAWEAYEQAHLLLGDHPVVGKLHMNLLARTAVAG